MIPVDKGRVEGTEEAGAVVPEKRWEPCTSTVSGMREREVSVNEVYVGLSVSLWPQPLCMAWWGDSGVSQSVLEALRGLDDAGHWVGAWMEVRLGEHLGKGDSTRSGALSCARHCALWTGSHSFLPAGYNYSVSWERNKRVPILYLCLCLRGESTF